MNLLHTSTGFSPGTLALAPLPAASSPEISTAAGVTFVDQPQFTSATADAALKSLRGFRTTGRRVAWCDASAAQPGEIWSWGRKLVERGGAEMVVACGPGGRDLALAARDEGLAIGRVVVCRDEATARNVLCDSLAPGDCLLVLGIDVSHSRRLAERLQWRLEPALAAVG